LGWTADRYVTAVSESIATVLEPAGLEKAKGLITGAYNKGRHRRALEAGRRTSATRLS
jgi:hypothetical protein